MPKLGSSEILFETVPDSEYNASLLPMDAISMFVILPWKFDWLNDECRFCY